MEIIKNFGFEPTFFIAQVINFLILAFIFQKYLYKPILKVLRLREEKIAQGIRDAENAAKEREQAVIKSDEIIRKATLASEKIIEETKSAALELKEKLTADAKKEAEKIILMAKDEAEQEFQKAESRATDVALALSKRFLDKILSEIFTKEEKAKIITRNIKQLEKYE